MPGAAGWNWTLNGAVCPAATTSGKVTPVTWKPEPNPVIELTVTEEEVLLEIESDSVGLLPTATVPKFRLLFATLTAPAAVGLEPPAKPPHPTRSSRPAAITREAARRK